MHKFKQTNFNVSVNQSVCETVSGGCLFQADLSFLKIKEERKNGENKVQVYAGEELIYERNFVKNETYIKGMLR